MPIDFSTEYSHRTDDELLRLASERDALTEEAAAALDIELRRRNLTESDRIDYQKFIKKQELREWRSQRRKKSGTMFDRETVLNKLVAAAFGGGLFFAYQAIPNQYHLRPDWEQAAMNVLVASTIILYIMGAWRQAEFWITLEISSAIHFLVLIAFAEKLPRFDYGPSTVAIVVGVAIFFLIYLLIWIWHRNARRREIAEEWQGESSQNDLESRS